MYWCGLMAISWSTCFSVMACETEVCPRSSRSALRTTFIAYSFLVVTHVAMRTLPNSPSPTRPCTKVAERRLDRGRPEDLCRPPLRTAPRVASPAPRSSPRHRSSPAASSSLALRASSAPRQSCPTPRSRFGPRRKTPRPFLAH